MAVIQPQYPAGIDWSNPITRGLVEAFLPGGTGYDAVARAPLSTTGAPGRTLGKWGVADDFNTSTYRFRNSARITSLAECSLVVGGMPDSLAVGTVSFGGYGSSASANPLFMLGPGATPTQLSFRCRNLANTNQETVAADSEWAAGVYGVFAGTRSESGNFQRTYVNGRQIATATATVLGATSFDRFSVGGLIRTSFGLALDSKVAFLLAYNRALTPVEVKSLAENPWQIFKAPTRRIFARAATTSYSLTASAGSFALAGQAATLRAACKLSADAGAFGMTGRDAGLTASRRLVADPGAFGLAGQQGSLRTARTLGAAVGAIALSGNTAELLYDRVLQASPGAFSLAGQDVALVYEPAGSYILVAGTGSFAGVGQDAMLRVDRRLQVEHGAFSLTGKNVDLEYLTGDEEYAPDLLSVPAKTTMLTVEPSRVIMRVPASRCIID